MDFELYKIFAMEPQAYRLEYEMGETWIEVLHAGQHVRYHCATAQELVTMHLADYVATLERRYVEKFPGHKRGSGRRRDCLRTAMAARCSGPRLTNGSSR